MSAQKRNLEEADPDYADVGDQQAKRQRALEEDAKQAVCRRIQSIIRNEFGKEITSKESELQQVDWRLNEARLMMDRLRACIVANYYGQANRSATSSQGTSNGPPASIHPTVKKYLGKVPRHHLSGSSNVLAHQDSTCEKEESNKIYNHSTNSVFTPVSQPSPAVTRCSTPVSVAPRPILSDSATYDDRRARFKIKKKIIVGNVSKYIPVDHREANDMSSHKWMVYVRGPRSDPNISSFVKKVWFFLHHSYKPNDLVEISSPPFHLTRRGWGEFPVRVQLHFVDSRNKTVDIIHHLKLDKTFTGLQTPGAETVLDVELDRDFFDTGSKGNNSATQQSGARTREQEGERVASKQMAVRDSVQNESCQLQVCQKSVSHVMIEHSSLLEETGDNCQTSTDHPVKIEHSSSLEETVDNCQSSTDQPKTETSYVLNSHDPNANVSQEEDLNIVDICSEKKSQIQTSDVTSSQKLETSPSGDIHVSTSSVVKESVPDEQSTNSTSVIGESSPSGGANVSLSVSENLLHTKQEMFLEDSDQQMHQVSSAGDLSSPSSLQCENLESNRVITVINPPLNSNRKTFSVVGANKVYQTQTLIQPTTGLNQKSVLTKSVHTLPSFSPKIETPQPAQQTHIQLLPQALPSNMQKLIVLNARNIVAHENTQSVIRLTKPNAPRQVSLLTGMVVNGQSAASNIRPVTPTQHRVATSLLAQRPSLVNQTLVLNRPTAQVLFMNNSLQQPVVRPNNPGIHIAAHQPVSVLTTGKVPEINGAAKPYPLTLTFVNQTGSAPKPVKQISLLKNVSTLPVSSITSPVLNAGVNNSSIVVNKPNIGSEQQDCSNHVYTKMSAVGITKHGKNYQKAAHLNPEKKVMTEEEKKRGPYDILKAWKKNPELYEKHSAKSKKIILAAKDRIEGEAEEIPELIPDDYPNLIALLKVGLKLHPLIQISVNKLTHPYCAESIEQWNKWPVGKQRANEWHRACFVLKYLKKCLGNKNEFKGKELMSTRQLVNWCRIHAYSPCAVVKKMRLDYENPSIQSTGTITSFTPVTAVEKELSHLLAREDIDDVELDPVSETPSSCLLGRLTERKVVDERLIKQGLGVEWIEQPSDGALFVFDELRKRGIKLQPTVLEPGFISLSVADILYKTMLEFSTDILREAVALTRQQHGSSDWVSRHNVHTALMQVPEAAFCCDKFLGKEDEGEDGETR